MSQPEVRCQYAGDKYKLIMVEVEYPDVHVRYPGRDKEGVEIWHQNWEGE